MACLPPNLECVEPLYFCYHYKSCSGFVHCHFSLQLLSSCEAVLFILPSLLERVVPARLSNEPITQSQPILACPVHAD